MKTSRFELPLKEPVSLLDIVGNSQRLLDGVRRTVPQVRKIEIGINAPISTRFHSPSLLFILSDDQEYCRKHHHDCCPLFILQNLHHLLPMVIAAC
jgi:hypothetical protein